MQTIYTLLLFLVLSTTVAMAQTVVKMDMPEQSDEKLQVVALFDETIPEGIPVVLGLMGYDIKGGIDPIAYNWMLNGEVISTSDIVIFTPKKGDNLSLQVTDQNKCTSTTGFNLKFAQLGNQPDENNSISIYPTLVNNYVHIDLPDSKDNYSLVRIFNTNGTLVQEETLYESRDLSISLPSGIYFISVRTGVQHKLEKIIVQ